MEKKVQNREERVREKERLSNIVASKMMIVFFALLLAVVLLFRVGKSDMLISFISALPYVQIGCAVLFLAALVGFIICYKRGVDAKEHVFSAPLLLGMSSVLFLIALLYNNFGGSFRTILVLLAFALLFFVYEIYSVDFFLCSTAVIVGCLCASVINNAGFHGMNFAVNCIAVALTVIVAFACAAIANRLHKNGKIILLGKRVRKPANMNPIAVYVGCAAAVIVVVGTLLFGHLLYWAAAVCIVYFVFAIIYTVKLI